MPTSSHPPRRHAVLRGHARAALGGGLALGLGAAALTAPGAAAGGAAAAVLALALMAGALALVPAWPRGVGPPAAAPPHKTPEAAVRDWAADGRGATLALVEARNLTDIVAAHGPGAGEAALKALESRLTCAAGDGACVTRRGEAVFAVVLPGAADDAGAGALGARLLAAAEPPVPAGTRHPKLHLAVGLARGAPAGAAPPYAAAQAALSQARLAPRGAWRVHDAAMAARMAARRSLEAALPDLLRDGRVEVLFQPQVRLPAGGSPVAFEALARVLHEGQPVAAADAVPVAEDAGLIAALDRLVLARALAAAAAWPGGAAAPRVSVNLSAASLLAPGLAEMLGAALARAALPPGRLTLEVTERALLADWRGAVAAIDAVRRMGARVALDDFRAGHEALSHLRRLRLDEVKLEGGLVRALETSREARFTLDAVADLAGELGMTLIATGVETDAQRIAAAELGCDCAQGHLFGRPVAAVQGSGLLAAFAPGNVAPVG